MTRLKLSIGDLTVYETDAIVNAANNALSGGGGVDGAIHRAAGPELLAHLKAHHKRLPTGEAILTPGFNLKASHIIHTVGPVWEGGGRNEPALLANCYRNSLRIARENGLRSLAFPSISTGAYRFPFELATRIAMQQVLEFLNGATGAPEVTLVYFSAKEHGMADSILSQVLQS